MARCAQSVFRHLAEETVSKHSGDAVGLATRRGQRLLRECVRAKKMMSSVPETSLCCEVPHTHTAPLPPLGESKGNTGPLPPLFIII